MPIGVPRIIYCWGEELPPQWTDIYNFIFRRRMVFLMQYLDDELCNQICGLLINIHMEDRSKELGKKDVEKSGVFKSSKEKEQRLPPLNSISESKSIQGARKKLKKEKSIEELLSSYSKSKYEEDLAIDENVELGQHTLQKITLEWLNWNAQFFDFSDEPYFFHLSDILSKDFSKDDTQSVLSDKTNLFGIGQDKTYSLSSSTNIGRTSPLMISGTQKGTKRGRDDYSPFPSIVNLAHLISHDKNFSIKNLSLPNSNNALGKDKKAKHTKDLLQQWPSHNLQQKPGLAKLIGVLASKDFVNQKAAQLQTQAPSKALGQRNLRSEYTMDNLFKSSFGESAMPTDLRLPTNKTSSFSVSKQKQSSALSYLDFDSTNVNQSQVKNLFKEPNPNEYSREQAKKAFREEESKKVFVIINSFGGSVGNGITVHDALQFIKAGSLTLGLGVTASAASLVLAGGTISERYVSEGCHTMIHQPAGEINGQASDIWIDSQEIMKIRLDVAEIYSLSAHRPRHKILRDLDRDFYLTAIETIHYGLADEIATSEVMQEIIEMTSKVWNYHDGKQQRLLETREGTYSGYEVETAQ